MRSRLVKKILEEVEEAASQLSIAFMLGLFLCVCVCALFFY